MQTCGRFTAQHPHHTHKQHKDKFFLVTIKNFSFEIGRWLTDRSSNVVDLPGTVGGFMAMHEEEGNIVRGMVFPVLFFGC
jgi:hypothetical protein